ncbi:MAG: acyltransferase [Deltaproteobacteria bacterium]|nr:acyltransferase [Deltaproteobacteria bacterium]
MVTVKTPDEGKIIIGNNVTIADFVVLFAENAEIRIGDNTGAEIGTQIIAIKSVTIGEFCLIAAYCVIRDMNHGMDISVPMALQKQEADPIVIGNDVWLGSHVVVTAGSKIGNGSVIGANAVVTSNIPAGAIAVGVPAKVVRLRGEIQK